MPEHGAASVAVELAVAGRMLRQTPTSPCTACRCGRAAPPLSTTTCWCRSEPRAQRCVHPPACRAASSCDARVNGALSCCRSRCAKRQPRCNAQPPHKHTSGVQPPLTSAGFSTFCHLCRHCTSVRPSRYVAAAATAGRRQRATGAVQARQQLRYQVAVQCTPHKLLAVHAHPSSQHHPLPIFFQFLASCSATARRSTSSSCSRGGAFKNAPGQHTRCPSSTRPLHSMPGWRAHWQQHPHSTPTSAVHLPLTDLRVGARHGLHGGQRGGNGSRTAAGETVRIAACGTAALAWGALAMARPQPQQPKQQGVHRHCAHDESRSSCSSSGGDTLPPAHPSTGGSTSRAVVPAMGGRHFIGPSRASLLAGMQRAAAAQHRNCFVSGAR